MASKQFNARQIQKHDTEADWDLTSGFIPFDGEIIIYDKDNTHDKPRMKVGDGVTDVKLLPFASGAVESVNNKTGAVTLNASDVGADPSGSASTVQGNLNTHTGNTTIHTNSTEKAAWNAKYNKPSGGIPKTDLASDVQTSLGKADTALQSAPVTSVNSKTGAVTLTASDVGALPSNTAIHNVPSGGTTGQVLTKSSGTDYDATWVTPSGGGGGGVTTVVYTKAYGSSTITCDHTYSQILALINSSSNTPVFGMYREEQSDGAGIGTGTYVNQAVGIGGYVSSESKIIFSMKITRNLNQSAVEDGYDTIVRISHSSNGDIEYLEHEVAIVPKQLTQPGDDNFYVLHSGSGELSWSSTIGVTHVDSDDPEGALFLSLISGMITSASQSPESLVRATYALGQSSIRDVNMLYGFISFSNTPAAVKIHDSTTGKDFYCIFTDASADDNKVNNVHGKICIEVSQKIVEVDTILATDGNTSWITLSAIAHETTSAMNPLNPGNPLVMPMVPAPVSGTLTLSSSSWTDNLDGTYSQSITITGSTNYSKIDLQPNAAVLAQLSADGVGAIYVTNQNNVLSAVAVGNAPTADLSVQYVMSAVYDGSVTPGGGGGSKYYIDINQSGSSYSTTTTTGDALAAISRGDILIARIGTGSSSIELELVPSKLGTQLWLMSTYLPDLDNPICLSVVTLLGATNATSQPLNVVTRTAYISPNNGTLNTTGVTWVDNQDGTYSADVTSKISTIINAITDASKVDMQPDFSTISQLRADGVTGMYIENNAGTLTLIVSGAQPTSAFSTQVTITNVY